jgi:transcription-repair coupling factor (superfamily II helicase)
MARRISPVTARDVILLLKRDRDLLRSALDSFTPTPIVMEALEHCRETDLWLSKLKYTKAEMYDEHAYSPVVPGRVRYLDIFMPKRCKNVFEKLEIEYLDEIRNFTMTQCRALGNCKKATLVTLAHILTAHGIFFKSESATEEQWKEERGLA